VGRLIECSPPHFDDVFYSCFIIYIFFLRSHEKAASEKKKKGIQDGRPDAAMSRTAGTLCTVLDRHGRKTKNNKRTCGMDKFFF
jgi:hypothetical protein